MAAVTPTASAPGVLVFEPFDSTTFAALDVVAQRYTAGAALAGMGSTTKLLTVPAMSPGLYFMTDDTDRLWVAGSDTSTTTYVVLAPTP